MTDLGHLLADTEAGVARARADVTLAATALDRTVGRVRRRRGLRHTRDAALGTLTAAVVGSVAWWAGTHEPPPALPAATPSASATPAPSPTAAATVATVPPVQVAAPQPVPPGLLESAEPGWVLEHAMQESPRAQASGVWEDGEARGALHLVSPTGERTTLLHYREPWASVGVLDWRAGERTALAAVVPVLEGTRYGTLDLLTGEFTQMEPLATDLQYAGTARSGESLWLTAEPPSDLPEGARLGGPEPAVAVGYVPQVLGDQVLPASWSLPARLQAVAPDGSVRVVADIGRAMPDLAPDGEWGIVVGTAGTPFALDLRTGEKVPLESLPTDPACRQAGWSGDHELLVGCPLEGGRWELRGYDVTGERPARTVATTDRAVRDAWPLGDGRIGVGLVVLPAPCDVTSDPAVLDGGVATPVTGQWGDADHGGTLVFAAGAVYTHLNGCYAGGRSGPQRDVRTDLATGATTTLGWLDDRRKTAPGFVAPDGWSDISDGFVVAR